MTYIHKAELSLEEVKQILCGDMLIEGSPVITTNTLKEAMHEVFTSEQTFNTLTLRYVLNELELVDA